MNLLLIVVLAGLMHAIRTFSAGGAAGSAGTLLAFGYVLLTAFFAGRLFKSAHLPKLTGYIVTGILVGPSVLGFLSADMVQNLTVINGMALALIALTAGRELDLAALRPYLKTIGWVSLIAVGGTTVLLGVAVYVGRDLLPFMAGLGTAQTIAVSLLLGVVLVAQSPAVVVALTDEMRADGPVSKTVLGVVVIADLFVIIVFAIVSVITKSALAVAGDMGRTVAILAWEILGSMATGVVLGALLALYLRKVKAGASLFILTIAFIVSEVGQRLALDPLILALSAGILIRNTTNVAPELKAHTEQSSLPVYIVFFAVAGATLHLDALALMGLPAALFVGVRAVGLFLGSHVGARVGGASLNIQRYVGFGLWPQAGLAIALSQLFAKTFPEFGPTAAALTLGVVALNELLAPAVYRMALVRSGEAGQRDSS